MPIVAGESSARADVKNTRQFPKLRLLSCGCVVLPFLRERIHFLASVVVATWCLLALLAPAHAQVPVIAEEIPAPPTVVEGLRKDLSRLEKEIKALRTQQDKAADAAEKKKTDDA